MSAPRKGIWLIALLGIGLAACAAPADGEEETESGEGQAMTESCASAKGAKAISAAKAKISEMKKQKPPALPITQHEFDRITKQTGSCFGIEFTPTHLVPRADDPNVREVTIDAKKPTTFALGRDFATTWKALNELCSADERTGGVDCFPARPRGQARENIVAWVLDPKLCTEATYVGGYRLGHDAKDTFTAKFDDKATGADRMRCDP